MTTKSTAMYSCSIVSECRLSMIAKKHTFRKISKTALPAPWLRKLKASVLSFEVADDTS